MYLVGEFRNSLSYLVVGTFRESLFIANHVDKPAILHFNELFIPFE